jgi:N-acetylglutamate synthase-like GNAT family acetyltransferase
MFCRRGKLEDLSKYRFAKGLSAKTESIEFNIVGMGHEFWIAVEDDKIVGLTVLGRTGPNQLTIMYLQVADAFKSHGVGSAMIRTIIAEYPETEFLVVPFGGTEDFYERLGFKMGERWEMRKPPSRSEG